MNTREEDFVEHLFITSTHNSLMFFTNTGKVFRLKTYELPEASRTAKGTAIVNLLQLSQGEKIAAVMPVEKFDDDSLYVLMATSNGLIKKTKLSEYANIRKTGIQAITLKENDELIDVRLTDGNNEIIMVTRHGLSIRFKEEEVRAVGRTSMGVKGIELAKDDKVVGMEPIKEDNGYVLTITENGFGKRTELEEYRCQGRAGKGVLTYKITAKTGNIVGVEIVVVRPLFVFFGDEVWSFSLFAVAQAHNALDPSGFVRVDEHIQAIGMFPQNVIGAAAHNDTGPLLGSFLNNIRLQDEQLVVDRHLVDAGHSGTKGIAAHNHGVQQTAGGLLVGVGEHLLRKAALFGSHGDQRLVVKGNIQPFGQLFPHFVASASVLAGNGDDRQHRDSSLSI